MQYEMKKNKRIRVWRRNIDLKSLEFGEEI